MMAVWDSETKPASRWLSIGISLSYHIFNFLIWNLSHIFAANDIHNTKCSGFSSFRASHHLPKTKLTHMTNFPVYLLPSAFYLFMISPNIFDLTIYIILYSACNKDQGSGNECGFYVAYHMIRLTATFNKFKGPKVSLIQI